MRALVQRVVWAKVKVNGETVGEIGPGLLVLLGVTHSDSETEARQLARKIAKLRIFNDAVGKMNKSVQEAGGAALVVSQFTLYADTGGGNRPSYVQAARPEQAIPLYETFSDLLRAEGLTVENGVFGADMNVELLNQGPVTIWLDTEQ